jgi:hypothetical protein
MAASEVREIAGCKVTVTSDGDIDTVRNGPKCQHCGKKLRPRYDTEKASITKERAFRSPPNKPGAKWDQARGVWVMSIAAKQIVKRKWRGDFGQYGDNLFCNLSCAAEWARKTAGAIVNGKRATKSQPKKASQRAPDQDQTKGAK